MNYDQELIDEFVEGMHFQGFHCFQCPMCKEGCRIMIFKCKFCKLHFDCKTFEEMTKHNQTQCYITVKGVPHNLKPYFDRKVKK